MHYYIIYHYLHPNRYNNMVRIIHCLSFIICESYFKYINLNRFIKCIIKSLQDVIRITDQKDKQ